jgi:hypothetical protein
MLARVAILSVLLAPGLLGQELNHTNKMVADLSWIRSFTVPAESSGKGKENLLNNDPRFVSLLHSSLPQHQFFWHDRGKFTSLPTLVQTFLGVPDKAVLEEQRYAVISGCVPHDCGDRGMVWIDTQSTTPALIFVATDHVNGGAPTKGSLVHLWMFSSTKLNWQQFPPSFISSTSQWWSTTSKVWDKYFHERVVIVSLVQPSGEIVTLSPALFSLTQSHLSPL